MSLEVDSGSSRPVGACERNRAGLGEQPKAVPPCRELVASSEWPGAWRGLRTAAGRSFPGVTCCT